MLLSIVFRLSEAKVQASPSEMAAVVQAGIECLRYCLMKHLSESEDDKAIQDLLITDQVQA